MATAPRTTLRVSNIPLSATAPELFRFFDTLAGPGSVFACEIFTERRNWKSKGLGRVQFESATFAAESVRLSDAGALVFENTRLVAASSADDIIVRPAEAGHRVEGGTLHAGFMMKADALGVMERWASLKVEVMPERKKVAFFVTGQGDGGAFYKMESSLDDLAGVFECRLGERKASAILLQVKYAPRIYHKISGPSIRPKFRNDRYHVCKEDTEFFWVRSTDFSPLKSIGQATHFCWELPEGHFISEILGAFPHYRKLENLNEIQVKPFCSELELVPIICCPQIPSFPYEVMFQLNSLVHAQKIPGPSVNSDLLHVLSSLSEDTANQILLKMHKLESACFEPVQYLREQLFRIQKSQLCPTPSSKTITLDKSLMSCHRVLVTPSKIYFLGPELETSNYVVNHYSEYASDFLRVSFVDEDWSKLPRSALSTAVNIGVLSKPFITQVYRRILSILENGIVVGPKKFEFLAFSASQLRSNGVWMFASNKSVTAQGIRDWMGNFYKIRSVSNCAARMGQLFSSSTPSFEVKPLEVDIIPDVEANTNGIKYCFSDGIGKISLSCARQIAKRCGLNVTPSAFQIRYGGYKGVIAVDRKSFHKISLRPSMLKFDSGNNMLCIVKWSESMPCYLNREIICLLSTLGIEDEIFECMQNDQMHTLNKMLTDREVALNVLTGMVGGDMKLVLSNMLLDGYKPNAEPYLFMMLRAYREYQLTDIRNKCRILVPKGRVLIGCLDEIGLLNYGQVYIRITMTETEQHNNTEGQLFFRKVDETTAIVLGKVVVTKNPCLHPGDIRVLEAVYEVALEGTNLMDCVVFPQKGARPHPNECSGGDLDGDLFFVCWDENLIPVSTDAPMVYLGGRRRIMDHDVTLEEIHTFFVNYMINDTLGAIATAHLVYADSEPLKARSPKCLQLAALHSRAVDFAKTGAPAEMPTVLSPKQYPDFLERDDRPMYPSPGILGKLYRAAVGYPLEAYDIEYTWDEASYDTDLEINGFEELLGPAESYKEEYAEKLTTIMTYYGAEREDELLTGNLRKKANYLNKDRRVYSEVKDRMLIAVKRLHKEMREALRRSGSNQLKMASAWYHVTYHPNFRFQSKTTFLSFPWILSDYLLNIKESKNMKIKEEMDF